MQKAGSNQPGFALVLCVLKEDVQSLMVLAHPAIKVAISD
jgi:hypothetical protein